jgi:hypothetical protein
LKKRKEKKGGVKTNKSNADKLILFEKLFFHLEKKRQRNHEIAYKNRYLQISFAKVLWAT